MGVVTSHISISLDGFVAGPDPTLADPLGIGGTQLHDWAVSTFAWREQHGYVGGLTNPDSDVIDEATANVGAYVMGRKMFGGGEGAWDEQWTGWWGAEPPFHAPVFVLTHHPREPLVLRGTTFTFVTEGIESALFQARRAAGDRDVVIAGGAEAIRQYIAAGLLDELQLHIVPVLLGSGERLLEEVGAPALEPVKVVASPAVTHVTYRILR